jgi:hypothetical protein
MSYHFDQDAASGAPTLSRKRSSKKIKMPVKNNSSTDTAEAIFIWLYLNPAKYTYSSVTIVEFPGPPPVIT